MTQASILITHCILWNTIPGPHKTHPRAAGGPRVEYPWFKGLPKALSHQCACLSDLMGERQFVKLEIWGLDPSLDTNFSLHIYYIYWNFYTLFIQVLTVI